MTETRSTCPYCGVGCGVVIETDGPQITGVRGDDAHPANFGRLCTKGAHAAPDCRPPSRCSAPAASRCAARSAAQARDRVTWDAALDHAADKFADIIREHGPDAVGVLHFAASC